MPPSRRIHTTARQAQRGAKKSGTYANTVEKCAKSKSKCHGHREDQSTSNHHRRQRKTTKRRVLLQVQSTRAHITVLPPTQRQTLDHHRFGRSHLANSAFKPTKSAGLSSHPPQ